MNPRKLALAGTVAALTLLAASCHDDDDALVGPMTLKQFAVNDVNNRSTDTAVPIEINDLTIDFSNEDPAQYDDLLQSS